MLKPSLPPNEEQRVLSLKKLKILDTPPEERFDRLTRLASKFFEMPICLISLIDDTRQWFKSKVGIDICETEREISFCSHAINFEGPFIIEDAALDVRFKDNPLVLKEPYIRFYAGIPLKDAQDNSLGTFCIIDRKPRQLTPDQLISLQDIALLAQEELNKIELNKALSILRGSEEELHDFIENTYEMIQTISPEGNFLSVNQAWLRNLGYSVEDLEKMIFQDILYMEEKQQEKLLLGLLRGENIKDVEAVLKSKSGNQIFVIGNATSYKRDKRLVFTRCIFHDITKLKQYERELKQFFQFSIDMLCISDFEGYFKQLNASFEKTLGFTEEELKSKPFIEFVHPDDRNQTLEVLNHLKVSKEVRGFENRYICKDGSIKWLSWYASPQPKENRIYAIARDVTNQKDLENELAYTRDKALESTKLKSEFLANMSHEIRTPINAIIGMSELLLETELNPKQLDFAKTVRGAAETLLDVINDILDFSKIEAGKLSIQLQEMEPQKIVESTVDILAIRAEEKGIEIFTSFSKDMPVRVKGDPARVRQILMNIIGNAIKFTEDGEVIVRVMVKAETETQTVIAFSVKDTGIGMRPEELSLLFKPFSQIDSSSSRKFGGTGLGLAICKRLTELMGGSISVESFEKKGSIFTFTIPFEKLDDKTVLQKPSPGQTFNGDLQILVVDDNPTNREILKQQLININLSSSGAQSGKQALEMLLNSTPNYTAFQICIVDMVMPEMDGLELIKKIRSYPMLKPLKILLLTSHSVSISPADVLLYDIDFCLTKPVKQSLLFECIEKIIQGNSEELAVAKPFHPERASGFNTRVLLVEDNPVNQKVEVLQLERLGYQAEVVSSGVEALQVLKEKTYDLILMDCQMPGMDGYQTTQEIRKNEGLSRRTPIIAITAHAMQGDQEKCLRAGMDDYISKPIKMEILSAILSKWSSNHFEDILKNMQELQGDGDVGFLKELCQVFISNSIQLLENLKVGLEKSDFESCQRLAHALKGSSGSIGAMVMMELCKKLEDHAREKDAAHLVDTFRKLEVEFFDVKKFLEKQFLS